MLAKKITYTDYDGNERTETFYFNLNKAELTEMELSSEGGLSKMIQKIVDEQDTTRIISIFKDIILRSYGEKSADGKRFIKRAVDGHRLADDFAQTEAYSELFMELATNADSASEFVNAIVPKMDNAPAQIPPAK
jgi:hypothetical protein